ncbi:hypothetical protein CFC21_112616 [Triticum aestivum]|uniref:Protein kinase domain-containing protein n=1 Tax=Triticum aestivum TaxID=4565 RepID=A0A9R0GL37_WHEAT|nr:cysteine-rich receptor-like protein kinase 45 [Triticum aestivum]XP_044446856.1 cysteine-rich receptor-like protein kinase 45 [Triticum aestivum]XP_044446857.1 cysteine-rich receptor-like protein kinase 45 [Triticum aestivum]XP_044447091.1 cysteine-rich receptor-like protein kinase 45 [Triticum aestivum]XP_044447092.1 cysteine-rich receptor-like protein kinase 45 [Triticum aestivum]MBC2899796.1 hypothetical protein [Triticum aestivum]
MDFELRVIEAITNNFADDQIVGSGGYGVVYRATHEGEEIAVKKLRQLPGLDDKQFDSEFRNLRNIRHQNVVRLIGYCYESRHRYMDHNGDLVFAQLMERVLCFEYMHGGSLDEHIQDKSCELEWPTCYKIIKGTSEGLNHLHNSQGKHIYHLDLKPGNILLDESMTPKIGDLGLSRLVASTKTRQTEMRDGTLGFVPPEYIKDGFISKKFDVFSLGVIIIKILAGAKNYIRCTEMPPEKFIQLVSENWTKKLQEKTGHSSHEIDILGVTSCVGIALRCVDEDRNKRPCIKDIVDELDQLEAKLKAMSLASDVSKDLTVQRSCDTNILSVDPTMELRFLFELRKEASCCLQLTNKTGGFIAFNIEINPNKYSVRPSQGTMPPCSRRYVVVTLSAQEAAPPCMRCEDMLLVQSIGVSQDLGEIKYQELFETAMANQVVDVVKLPIAYVTLDQ